MKDESLDSIMLKTGTDKASKHPVKGHNYAVVYDELFTPFRHEQIRVLEIGVGSGVSIQAWLAYFPNGHIFGVDRVHDTNPYNTPPSKINGYTFNTGDMSDPTFWKCLDADWPGGFDIVIEDGSHMNRDTIECFKSLWPLVNNAGLYCIEDMGVGDDSTSVFVLPGYPTHLDWLRDKLREVNKVSDIAQIRYTTELAVFRKRG